MPRHKSNELFASSGEQRIVSYQQTADPILHKRREGRVKVTFGANVQNQNFLSKRARCFAHFFRTGRGTWMTWVDKNPEEAC